MMPSSSSTGLAPPIVHDNTIISGGGSAVLEGWRHKMAVAELEVPGHVAVALVIILGAGVLLACGTRSNSKGREGSMPGVQCWATPGARCMACGGRHAISRGHHHYHRARRQEEEMEDAVREVEKGQVAEVYDLRRRCKELETELELETREREMLESEYCFLLDRFAELSQKLLDLESAREAELFMLEKLQKRRRESHVLRDKDFVGETATLSATRTPLMDCAEGGNKKSDLQEGPTKSRTMSLVSNASTELEFSVA